MVLSLCACSSGASPAAQESPAPAEKAETAEKNSTPLYETSGVIGIRSGNEMRFDSFGLTVRAPEAVSDWQTTDRIPETFAQLDEIIEKEGCYNITWTEFPLDGNRANFNVIVMQNDEWNKEQYVMDWFLESVLSEQGVKSAEIKNIKIGDRNAQKCFTAQHIGDDGKEENVIVFDKLAGPYRIECAARTYDGCLRAEEVAKMVFFLDAPSAQEISHGVSGIVGVRSEDSVRFENFGLTVYDPEGVTGGYYNENIPESYDELDDIINAEGYYDICRTEFENENGTGAVGLLVAPCGTSKRESYSMKVACENFKKNYKASKAEVVRMTLGDYPEQRCCVITYKDEDGNDVNALYFNKICGRYFIEGSVETRGWEGAEEMAAKVFSLDAPTPKPFHWTENGLFVLDDLSILEMNIGELRSVIGYFADPLPFYDDISISTLECGDYNVSLQFDRSYRLYCIESDGMPLDIFDSSLKEADDNYLLFQYFPMSDNKLGDKYQFIVGDMNYLTMNKTYMEEDQIGVCQSYYTDLLDPEQVTNVVDAVYSELRYRNRNYVEKPVDYTVDKAMAVAQWAGEHGVADGYGIAGLIVSYVQKDPDGAVPWFEKAAEGGCAFAMNNLGMDYIDAVGDEKPDYDKGARYYIESYKRGDTRSYSNLVYRSYCMDEFSEETVKDMVDTFRELAEEGAENGSAYSMCMMGIICELEGDYERGYDLLKKGMDSRELGFTACREHLGLMYLHGSGLDAPDYDKAVYYLTEDLMPYYIREVINDILINHNDELSQETLSRLKTHIVFQHSSGPINYDNMYGVYTQYVDKNYRSAFKFYNAALEKGIGNYYKGFSHFYLGNMYAEGLGMDEPDYDEAASHYISAVEFQNEKAEPCLKELIENHSADISADILAKAEKLISGQ